MAGATGLEPVTLCLEGIAVRRINDLARFVRVWKEQYLCSFPGRDGGRIQTLTTCHWAQSVRQITPRRPNRPHVKPSLSEFRSPDKLSGVFPSLTSSP